MEWRETARAQAGVISRRQLREAGLADRAITRLVDRDQLWRVVEGHFLVGGAPLTYRAKCWVATLSTGGSIGFQTAANFWGVQIPRPEQVHVCVDHRLRSHGPAWATLHRVELPPWARTERELLPITTKTWTVLDLIVDGGTPSDASALFDRGMQQSWLTPQDVERRLVGAPGRPGNGRLRSLLAQAGDGAAARSERLLHRILRQGGLSGWQPNYRVALSGRTAFVDVAFPELRIAIEVDGWAYHSDVERFRDDRERQNLLVAAGWTVLRFTWADLTERPDYVLAAIRNAGAQKVAQ